MARKGRDMSGNRRDSHPLSREAASPVGGDAMTGRGDQPRPEGGRGKARRSTSAHRGRFAWPRRLSSTEVVYVVPSRPSLPFALGKNIDFHDKFIEAIRNLPESHSDSLEFFMGSDSSQKIVASPIHIQSDELESSVAPQSKLRWHAMDVENYDSSLSLEEFDFLRNKLDPTFVSFLPG
ncbi:UNVERIFIED_CONTAM: hypothetical protein Slati_2665600 [Sesamum latifolium]|uniref:Uncharacterized protein n=1 Tax=Sesamum latifolium TaxID=2727402 RepID=A0AAW2VV54_9LAMI